MGLDITAYSKLVRVHPTTDVEKDEAISLCVVDEVYRPRLEGLEEGEYECAGESHGFRAGSYSGYNRWREHLAALVGTTPERVWAGEKPAAFEELISFSDCEGAIGPVVSAKLARDFAEWHGRVSDFAPSIQDANEREWFVAKYTNWREAFELAADGGAVDFH